MDEQNSESAGALPQRLFGGLIRRLSRAETAQSLIVLADALLSGRGEASGVALAKQLLGGYVGLPPAQRLAFLEVLSERFGCDTTRLDQAITAYTAEPTAPAASELHAAAEPRRQELIRRLNLAPGGTASLVRMREDVLTALPDHPELQVVDADFVHLLSSWFNRGFLELQRIDWRTPAHILEKIIRYEAVHAIASWDDLQRRLAPPDRRCFAFFHPQLPDEPLIFVEVALTAEMPGAIAPLLADRRPSMPPHKATTAVFYSISNCQVGLKGISLGSFLIKQVAEDLKRELPSLQQFVTLSPVPGFMRWLSEQRSRDGLVFLSRQERDVLAALERDNWASDATAATSLQTPLLTAAAHYLLAAKNVSGKPIDPVARFHLGNGARLHRINMLGDVSPKGLSEAAGVMVNYLYDLSQIERNHEAYANAGEVVASHAPRRLLRTSRRASTDGGAAGSAKR